MKILKRTPRVDMAQRVIGKKMQEIVNRLAEELSYPVEEIDRELTLFGVLSTRFAFEPGEIDFSPAASIDTDAVLAEKFIAYLDTNCVDVLDAAWPQLAEYDKPADKVAAPMAPDPKDRT